MAAESATKYHLELNRWEKELEVARTQAQHAEAESARLQKDCQSEAAIAADLGVQHRRRRCTVVGRLNGGVRVRFRACFGHKHCQYYKQFIEK